MSTWHPTDLVTDDDLLAYEATILSQFGQDSWLAKRTRALEDWLFPVLRGAGFDPHRLRTRFDADAVVGFTGAAYSDLTAASQSATADDVDLAAVFATPATDALYVGSAAPFRGLSLALLDAVSSVAGELAVTYWAGSWKTLPRYDGTVATSGKTLSGGGSIVWDAPHDWATRTLSTFPARYWVKVTVSATPTGAKARQVAVVRASSLRAPLVFRTLELIMREAPTSSDGPWRDKAEYYAAQADQALQRALPLVGGEFDTDASDQVSEAEAAQTSAEASGTGGWHLERG
jgi:hypothetical protein